MIKDNYRQSHFQQDKLNIESTKFKIYHYFIGNIIEINVLRAVFQRILVVTEC
jgi:hypothetical protein